jgi:hypothetical protein
LQEKYKIRTSCDATLVDSTKQQNSSSSTTTTTAAARAALLQHLAEFKQRAAAIKASADAVHAWHSQQQGPAAAAAALPAEVLMVLNKEAEKGLLHMLQGRARGPLNLTCFSKAYVILVHVKCSSRPDSCKQ